MNLPAPENAPKRTDLPFLRRRSRPGGASTKAAPAANPALAAFLTSRGARPNRAGRASGAGELDLSAPTQPSPLPPPVLPPAPVPLQPPVSLQPPASSALDLSDPIRPAAASARKPSPPPVRARAVARTRPAAPTLLTSKAPTVTLTRLQSGIGTLTFTAVCPPEVGDLRLGCAYQLRSGHTSTLQHADGRHSAPHNSRRPVIVARRDQYERITIDLRQCREVERLIIYGYSESGAPLRWGGTLIAATFGQTRIQAPLDAAPSDGVGVILSLYNVRGEFVLRAELEMISGSVRDACNAYGFDRITWLDAKTPVG